ncbi:lipid-transfer protein [Neptunomonas japonica]|uniref:propanoyl-CoA C-acyltransferase n=1 Tax=Neptunomonas japonica JAMM 1380 TaxID=1441457 RepID=A0A7R6PU32_9GAMM|nr:lipid-transfer protein [Neptunomonas japonica]BBB30485.1 lipid-transfer protein [Neptunomonas japonica JAMM 1380]
MSNFAQVAGVGMVKFCKPGQQEPYRVMAAKAIREALKDAGIELKEVQQAYASYIYGDSTCGQHALYEVGQTGIPVVNVNNNCSSGSTALFLARQAVQSGAVECALAFGFEEMQPGALGSNWEDRESPFDFMLSALEKSAPDAPAGPLALRMFGSAGTAYIDKYNANPDIFAKVSVKTRSHAVKNPLSLFTNELTVEEVMSAPSIYAPYLTRLMACPPTCGAAAVVVCSASFARKHGISAGVEIIGQSMATDIANTWDNPIDLIGAKMTKKAAQEVYEQAGFGPESIDVIELHDCFTPNEVITYEGLGLCPEGGAEKFINDGDNTYGGQFVVNPSGGLMSKGHPIGATGLAQCTELTWHLRGTAGERQVENANVALQHNLGLGGAVVVTMYRKA